MATSGWVFSFFLFLSFFLLAKQSWMDRLLATSSYLLCSDHYLNKWYSLGSKSKGRDTEKAFYQSAGLPFPFHESFVFPEDPSSVEQFTKEWDGLSFCLGWDIQSVPSALLQMSGSFGWFSVSIQIKKWGWNSQHTFQALGAAEMESNVQVFCKVSSDKVSRRYIRVGALTYTAEKKQVLKDAGSRDSGPCFQ